MPFYLQVLPNHELLAAWEIEGKSARRVGVPNAEKTKNAYFEAGPGESIWQAIQRQTDWFANGVNPFHQSPLSPGEFYFRIARPGANQLHGRTLIGPSAQPQKDALAIARSQLLVLIRLLQRICQTVHPSEKTWDAYGHDIRNLLILACTEVESHWRAVLVANGYQSDRYCTNDYVKIEPAMKLRSYGLSFREYPWLPPIRPFGTWGLTRSPTKELDWYDSYNEVKHDRETSFYRGTLGHAFNAVSASAVMLAAQFGFHDAFERSEFGDALLFCEFPQWQPSDAYIHSESGGFHAPRKYSF
jgi:hypothetical protein